MNQHRGTTGALSSPKSDPAAGRPTGVCRGRSIWSRQSTGNTGCRDDCGEERGRLRPSVRLVRGQLYSGRSICNGFRIEEFGTQAARVDYKESKTGTDVIGIQKYLAYCAFGGAIKTF
ncbi:MAG TPA: hypothetical protein VIS99_15230 [Terrimicrobiaceae bacterium]